MVWQRIKSGFQKSLGPHKYYCNFWLKKFSLQGVTVGCAQDMTSWQPFLVAFPRRADEYPSSLGTRVSQAVLSLRGCQGRGPESRRPQDLHPLGACFVMDLVPFSFMFFLDVARSQFPLLWQGDNKYFMGWFEGMKTFEWVKCLAQFIAGGRH